MPSVENYYQSFRKKSVEDLKTAFLACLAIYRSSRGRDREVDYAILLAAYDVCVQRDLRDWADAHLTRQKPTDRPVNPVSLTRKEEPMSIFNQKATTGGGSSEVPEAGSQPAVLVALIDCGSHMEEFTQKDGSKKNALLRKVYLAWELTEAPNAGFKRNHVIGKEYSLTFSPKSGLRKMIEGWRGKAFGNDEEFELAKLVGKPCVLTIVHKEAQSSGNTYAQIGGVAGLTKGMPAPKGKLTPFSFEIGPDAELEALPVWLPYTFLRRELVPIRKVIEASKEWREMTGFAPTAANNQPANDLAGTLNDSEAF